MHEEKAESYLSTPTHTLRGFSIDSAISTQEVDNKQRPLALIDKISVHSKRLSSVPASLPSHNAHNDYIGKNEDEIWWQQVDPSKESEQNNDDIYSILIKNIGIFRWQNAQYVHRIFHYWCALYKPTKYSVDLSLEQTVKAFIGNQNGKTSKS